MNGPVLSITEPDSSGRTFLGGQFSAFQDYETGYSARINTSTGVADISWPKISGGAGGAGVFAVARDSAGHIYIGGDFPQVDGQARAYIARLSDDGQLDTTWNVTVNGPVTSFALADNGTLYVGGSFTTVNGSSRFGLAAIDSSGSLSPWYALKSGSYVKTLKIDNGTLYVGGGGFTQVWSPAASQYVTRNLAAAYSVSSGNLMDWDPNVTAPGMINDLAISGDTVYFVGSFSTVGGSPRNKNAAVNKVTGALLAWQASLSSGGALDCLAISGNSIIISGPFTEVGVVGRSARSYLSAFDATSGAVDDTFNLDFTGSGFSAKALAVSDGRLYVGTGGISIFRGKPVTGVLSIELSNPTQFRNYGASQDASIRALLPYGNQLIFGGVMSKALGLPRYSIAAVEANGSLSEWSPYVTGPSQNLGTVNSVVQLDGAVYFGGNFVAVNGVPRKNAAAVSAADGSLLPWNPDPDGVVSELAVAGNKILLGGSFTKLNGLQSNRIAVAQVDSISGLVTNWDAGVSGSPGGFSGTYVKALLVSGNTVYLGGRFQNVGSSVRTNLAAVSTETGVVDPTWNPSPNGSEVTDVTKLNSSIYFAGTFDRLRPNAGSDVLRNKIAAYTVGGAIDPWNPVSGFNNFVNSIYGLGDRIYVGGAFTQITLADSSVVTRNRAAAFDSTGSLDALWDPSPNGSISAVSRALSTDSVIVAGAFSQLGPTASPLKSANIASTSRSSSVVDAWPRLSSEVTVPPTAPTTSSPNNPGVVIPEGGATLPTASQGIPVASASAEPQENVASSRPADPPSLSPVSASEGVKTRLVPPAATSVAQAPEVVVKAFGKYALNVRGNLINGQSTILVSNPSTGKWTRVGQVNVVDNSAKLPSIKVGGSGRMLIKVVNPRGKARYLAIVVRS
ncbi:MAG: hypothetical protein ACKOAF_10455 [Actinomycetes bacterium]